MIRSRCFLFAMLCSRFASIAASFLAFAQKHHPLAVEMALGAGDAAEKELALCVTIYGMVYSWA